MVENIYMIEGVQFELYTAASGDWCVTVDEYGKEREHYNLGSKEDALSFILSYFEVVEEMEEEE